MNIAKMMQQANKMQNDVKALQEKLNQTDIDSTLSGIAITMTVGTKQLKKLSIDAGLIDPTDKETLEDLIVIALKDAVQKVEATSSARMSGLMPAGMKLPF